MVSRSVGNSTPGALAAAGVPDETITVVLRLLDQFSRPWDRATASMDVGMRRVEAGLNRFQHHAYQLEGLASRYTRARNEIATAEEQATERMTRSLRRAEGAIQSYDRVISGQTSLRGQQQQVQTRRRQDSDQLLNRAAFLEGEISRARQAQPIAEDRTRTLEGRIAGSRNLDMGMGHEDALFGMHQLRESRRQSQVYRSKLADIEQFQQATLRQSGIIDERLQNATGNRERMGGAIDSMRGARFRSAATVASYRATFPEAGRLIEEMGPDLGRHYFTRNLERGDAFPVPELHRDALKQFGGERRPSDFKSQLSQREFDAQVNREGGDEDSQWRAARRHYTSRSFTPETAADRQLQAMFNFDRHADALTMSARAPNRIIYPGDRQLGAEPGSDYGPVPTGPQRVQQGEDLRFRLDKQPQLYTTENYRNYVRQAEANFPTPGTSNEMWNVPSEFSTSRSDYRRMLRDPQEFSPFFVPPREREILFRKEMLGMDFDLESDPRLLSATGPFLDKAPTSNQESMRSMREWVGRPANRPLTQYRGRIYRTDPELPDDMRGELDDALFNRAPPYMEDRYRTAQLPKTYTGRGFMRKFTGALPDDLTGGGSAAADALEYIYALESRPHIGRELDFLEGEMPMTVASEADLGRRAEALQGDAATQSSLRDKFTSKYNAAVGRGDRLQEDLVNQLSLRENPAEFQAMQGRFNEWEDTHLRSRGLTLPSDLTAPVMVEPEGLARPMTLEQLQTEFQGIARAGQTVTPPSPTPGAWESARPVFPTRNPLITDPNELWEAVGDLGLSREQLSSQRSAEIERDLGPRDLRRDINRWSQLTYHPQVSSGADPTQPAAWTVGDRPLTSDEQSERMDAAFNRYLEGQAGRDKEIFDANRGALERYDAQSDLSEITPSAFTDAEGAPLSRERWEQTRGSAQARTASVADWERELGQIRTEAGPDNYAAYIRKMERELEVTNLQLARVDPNAEIAQDIGAPQRREARGHWRNMLQERMLDLTDVPDVEAVTGAADRTGMAQARIGEVEGQRMPFWQGELAQARSKKIALSEHFTSTFDWQDSLPDENMVAGYMSDTDRLLSDFETNEAEMRQLQGRRKRATLPGTIAGLDQDINSLHARQVETVNSLNAYWDPMEGELQAARADFDKESTNLNTLNERVTRASQFSPAQRGALDTEWDNVLASADKAEQARVRRDRAELDEQRTRRRGDTIADDAQHYERMTEVHKMRAEDAQSPADIEENKARTERSRKRAEELRWQQGSVQSFDLDAASANVTSAELGFQTAMRDRGDAELSLGRMRQSFLGGADPLAAGRGKLADFEEDLRFKSQGMSPEGKKIIEQMMATQRGGDYMTPENLTELDQMLTEMDQVGTTASKTQGQTRDRLGMRRLQAPTKAQEIRTGLNRNIKRLEDAQTALAEREGQLGELPEGEDRERTAAEASRLRERLGPHSGATLGRLRDKRDEFDAVVQQEMMGAPLKRGANESDVEWSQRGLDREAGGFQRRMRDRKPRLGWLRENALSHLRFQEDTIRPMDTDPRLLGTSEERGEWRTERDANQQIFRRLQSENAPLEMELGELEKIQTEDLGEWERLSKESRDLGPGVEQAQTQRQKIDSGSAYRRNLGATRGALIATYMTQTIQGLGILTAGLSVVGMMMGMALMPLFDKMSKWWQSVQQAKKAQEQIKSSIRSTNLELANQEGILRAVNGQWDRKTLAALAGLGRTAQVNIANQPDAARKLEPLAFALEKGVGLEGEEARATAGQLIGGQYAEAGATLTDRIPQDEVDEILLNMPGRSISMNTGAITRDLMPKWIGRAERKYRTEYDELLAEAMKEPTPGRTGGVIPGIRGGGEVGKMRLRREQETRWTPEVYLADIIQDLSSPDLYDVAFEDGSASAKLEETIKHYMFTRQPQGSRAGSRFETDEPSQMWLDILQYTAEAGEDGEFTREEAQLLEKLLRSAKEREEPTYGRRPDFDTSSVRDILDLNIRARALGGTVGAGEITLVGEEGPEIVKLPPGSEVVPNERINDYGDWSTDQRIGRREQVSRDGVLRDYGDWSSVQRRGQNDDWYEKHIGSLQKTVIELPGLGSGVMVDPSGIIATNRHVVEGHEGRYLSVELPGVGEFAAEVIYTDAEKDLAILRLVAPGNYESISLADSITKGERMAGVGFAPVTPERGAAAGNVDMTFTPGTVTEDEDIGEGWRSWLRKKVGLEGKNPWAYDDLIKGSGYAIPGQSGGAMINEAGELLGITSRGVGGLARERPYWMSKEIAGVPVDYLRTVLEELDITPRLAGGTVQPGETSLVGEEGPEIAEFPPGTKIHPNNSAMFHEWDYASMSEGSHSAPRPVSGGSEYAGPVGLGVRSDSPDYAPYVIRVNTGSGVILNSTGLVATNRHVVDNSLFGPDKNYVMAQLTTKAGAEDLAAKVIMTSAAQDLAFLQLPPGRKYPHVDPLWSRMAGDRKSHFGSQSPDSDEAWTSIGFPPRADSLQEHAAGQEMDVPTSWELPIGRKIDTAWTTSGTRPGYSGGGTFDELGNLQAITARGGGEHAAGISADAVAEYVEAMGQVIGRRGGGQVQPGETTLVGEEGPEVVKLPGGSQVFPNGQGPSLSSGLSVAPSPNLTNDDWHDILRITTNRSKELTRGMGDFLAEMTESWVNTYDNMEKTTDSSLSAQFMRTLDLAEAFKFESDPEEEELGPSLSETHADSLLDLASFQAWANGALGSVRDASVAAFMAAYTEVAFPIGSGVHDTLQKITDWTAETVIAGYDWGLKTFNTAKGWFQSLWENETTDPEGESPDGDLPWYQDVMDWVTTTAVAGYKWGLTTFNTAKDWFRNLWTNETDNPEGESPEEEPNTLQKVANWVFDIAVLGYEWGLETFNTVKSWFESLWTNKTTDPEGPEPDAEDGTLQQVVTWIAKTAVAAYDWGKDTFNSLKTWAQNLWEATFGGSGEPEGASYGDDLAHVDQRSTLREVVWWIGDTATAAYAWGKDTFNSLKTWANNLWNAAPIEIDFGPELEETLETLQAWFADVISRAWEAAKSAFDRLRRRMRNLGGRGSSSSSSNSGDTSSSTPELPAVPPGPGAGDYMDADGNIHHIGDDVVPGWTPPPGWAKMARGGTVLGAGWGMVGEEGPEFMNMPVGASVVPLPPGGYNRAMGSGNGEGRNLEISLVVDGHILKTMVVEMLDDYIRERAPDAMLV